jgi:hypothetical protein
MHTYIDRIRTRLLNIGSFVGVIVKYTQLTTITIRQREDPCMNFVQHTQLTPTTFRQRNDSCMILSNSCLVSCDELHFQACHEYWLHESDDVSWSVDTWIIGIVVSSFAWSCNNRNWQRQPSVKGKTHALFCWIVALFNAMIGMSSRHLFWILSQCVIYVCMFLCMYACMSSYVFSLFSVSRSHIYVYIYIHAYIHIYN